MRNLTPAEINSLREALSMEMSTLAGLKLVEPMISDDKLKTACITGISASEARIKGIQQFIQDNQVLGAREVQ